MLAVARHQRLQQRKLEIQLFSPIRDRAQVLRQARTAECEPGRKVSRGDIELGIGHEDLRDLIGFDAEMLAESADLVGKSNLDRVIQVRNVLHHLGHANGGFECGRGNVFVEFA